MEPALSVSTFLQINWWDKMRPRDQRTHLQPGEYGIATPWVVGKLSAAEAIANSSTSRCEAILQFVFVMVQARKVVSRNCTDARTHARTHTHTHTQILRVVAGEGQQQPVDRCVSGPLQSTTFVSVMANSVVVVVTVNTSHRSAQRCRTQWRLPHNGITGRNGSSG